MKTKVIVFSGLLIVGCEKSKPKILYDFVPIHTMSGGEIDKVSLECNENDAPNNNQIKIWTLCLPSIER